MKVVIVGGAVAGTAAAVRLRHLDEQADIILIEKGPDWQVDTAKVFFPVVFAP